jgi:fermentation-respiration switch protein FrsA (DUF1100 family)
MAPAWIFIVLRLIVALAVIYGLVCVWAHFQSQRMLFLNVAPNYSATDPAYVTLTTPDGVKLYARHWPNPSAKYTLLYFHGNGEELGSLSGYLDDYVRAGFSVLAYDYRGYGHSGGSPGEGTCYADAKLLLDWLRQQGTPPERVVAFGFSLGGGSAVELARTEPIAGLIIEGSFVSAYRVMTRRALVLGDKFQNERKLAEVKCPVLVLHGTADPVIPVWHGQALYAAANHPKKLLLVSGGGHGGLENVAKESYWGALREFADSLK